MVLKYSGPPVVHVQQFTIAITKNIIHIYLTKKVTGILKTTIPWYGIYNAHGDQIFLWYLILKDMATNCNGQSAIHRSAVPMGVYIVFVFSFFHEFTLQLHPSQAFSIAFSTSWHCEVQCMYTAHYTVIHKRSTIPITAYNQVPIYPLWCPTLS